MQATCRVNLASTSRWVVAILLVVLLFLWYRSCALFYDDSIPSEFSATYQPLYRCSMLNAMSLFSRKSDYQCYAENKKSILEHSRFVFGPIIHPQFSTCIDAVENICTENQIVQGVKTCVLTTFELKKLLSQNPSKPSQALYNFMGKLKYTTGLLFVLYFAMCLARAKDLRATRILIHEAIDNTPSFKQSTFTTKYRTSGEALKYDLDLDSTHHPLVAGLAKNSSKRVQARMHSGLLKHKKSPTSTKKHHSLPLTTISNNLALNTCREIYSDTAKNQNKNMNQPTIAVPWSSYSQFCDDLCENDIPPENTSTPKKADHILPVAVATLSSDDQTDPVDTRNILESFNETLKTAVQDQSTEQSLCEKKKQLTKEFRNLRKSITSCKKICDKSFVVPVMEASEKAKNDDDKAGKKTASPNLGISTAMVDYFLTYRQVSDIATKERLGENFDFMANKKDTRDNDVYNIWKN